MNEEKFNVLENMAIPIKKFLTENYNPYTAVLITQECVKTIVVKDYAPLSQDSGGQD